MFVDRERERVREKKKTNEKKSKDIIVSFIATVWKQKKKTESVNAVEMALRLAGSIVSQDIQMDIV